MDNQPSSLEEIRAFFANDKYATDCTGAIIEDAKPGYAKTSFDIGPQHMNAAGSLMGGAIFTLADFAFAVASNCEKLGNVAVSMSIQFFNAAKGSKLIAEAFCEKDGHKLCFYKIEITDELGTKIASVSATGYKHGK